MHDSAPSATLGSLRPEDPVYRMLEAVIFEQWIRFSWIVEDADGDFCIQIPEITAQEIGEDYSQFKPLLDRLNGTVVDANMACSAILAFAQDEFGENASAVLEDPTFQEEVARFHHWLYEQVEVLEERSYNFDQWKTMFVASFSGNGDATAGTPA